jgi:hypothetical protein
MSSEPEDTKGVWRREHADEDENQPEDTHDEDTEDYGDKDVAAPGVSLQRRMMRRRLKHARIRARALAVARRDASQELAGVRGRIASESRLVHKKGGPDADSICDDAAQEIWDDWMSNNSEPPDHSGDFNDNGAVSEAADSIVAGESEEWCQDFHDQLSGECGEQDPVGDGLMEVNSAEDCERIATIMAYMAAECCIHARLQTMIDEYEAPDDEWDDEPAIDDRFNVTSDWTPGGGSVTGGVIPAGSEVSYNGRDSDGDVEYQWWRAGEDEAVDETYMPKEDWEEAIDDGTLVPAGGAAALPPGPGMGVPAPSAPAQPPPPIGELQRAYDAGQQSAGPGEPTPGEFQGHPGLKDAYQTGQGDMHGFGFGRGMGKTRRIVDVSPDGMPKYARRRHGPITTYARGDTVVVAHRGETQVATVVARHARVFASGQDITEHVLDLKLAKTGQFLPGMPEGMVLMMVPPTHEEPHGMGPDGCGCEGPVDNTSEQICPACGHLGCPDLCPPGCPCADAMGFDDTPDNIIIIEIGDVEPAVDVMEPGGGLMGLDGLDSELEDIDDLGAVPYADEPGMEVEPIEVGADDIMLGDEDYDMEVSGLDLMGPIDEMMSQLEDEAAGEGGGEDQSIETHRDPLDAMEPIVERSKSEERGEMEDEPEEEIIIEMEVEDDLPEDEVSDLDQEPEEPPEASESESEESDSPFESTSSEDEEDADSGTKEAMRRKGTRYRVTSDEKANEDDDDPSTNLDEAHEWAEEMRDGYDAEIPEDTVTGTAGGFEFDDVNDDLDPSTILDDLIDRWGYDDVSVADISESEETTDTRGQPLVPNQATPPQAEPPAENQYWEQDWQDCSICAAVPGHRRRHKNGRRRAAPLSAEEKQIRVVRAKEAFVPFYGGQTIPKGAMFFIMGCAPPAKRATRLVLPESPGDFENLRVVLRSVQAAFADHLWTVAPQELEMHFTAVPRWKKLLKDVALPVGLATGIGAGGYGLMGDDAPAAVNQPPPAPPAMEQTVEAPAPKTPGVPKTTWETFMAGGNAERLEAEAAKPGGGYAMHERLMEQHPDKALDMANAWNAGLTNQAPPPAANQDITVAFSYKLGLETNKSSQQPEVPDLSEELKGLPTFEEPTVETPPIPPKGRQPLTPEPNVMDVLTPDMASQLSEMAQKGQSARMLDWLKQRSPDKELIIGDAYERGLSGKPPGSQTTTDAALAGAYYLGKETAKFGG